MVETLKCTNQKIINYSGQYLKVCSDSLNSKKFANSIYFGISIFMLKKILNHSLLCMILSCLFFALMATLMKAALKEVAVTEAVFFRSLVSAFVIAFLMRRQKQNFKANRPLLLVGRSLAGFCALSANFFALSRIPLGDAALLNQTSPIFVALLSVWLLKEKFQPKVLALSLLSLVGVAFIVKPEFGHFEIGYGAALISGFLSALAYVAIRNLHQSEQPLTMAFYFTAISALLISPSLFFYFSLPTTKTFIILFLGGLAGTLGQLFITYAYKNEEASKIAPFAFIAVPFSFLFGMIFFKESPGFKTVLGFLLIFLASWGIFKVKR